MLKGKKRKIVVFGAAALALVAVGIGCFCLFNPESGVLAKRQVTVSFDSGGGSDVASQTVPKGAKLPQVATPVRAGCVFAGWFYGEAPVDAYRQGDAFSRDTTLHAAWVEPEMKEDKAEFIRDCDKAMSFTVRSDTALTQANLAEYVSFSSVGIEDGKTLSVKPQDGFYLLYAEGGFTPGCTYCVKLLDSKAVRFVKAGDADVSDLGVTSYSFTVFRENVNNVAMKAQPRFLSADCVSELTAAGKAAAGATGNIADDGKTVYRATIIKDNGEFKAGDILSIGADAASGQYYKVLSAEKDAAGTRLELIAPNMDELYSEFEVYYAGDAVKFEEDAQADGLAQSFQAALKQSRGYDALCAAIAGGVKQSPTLLKTVSAMGEGAQRRFAALSADTVKDLLKNVNFQISFGKTQDIANKDNGCYGKIQFTTGDIDISLAENLSLTINLTMSEDVTATAYGWQKLDGGKLYLDNGVYVNNKFGMSFSTVVATDSGSINITDEIQKLVDSQSGDKTELIAQSLNSENLFGEDPDYVEILSKRLGERTVDIYDVLSIQFTLDFKVSLGLRAGLDLNFNSTELRKIGMCNVDYTAGELKTTDMKHYSERMKTTLQFTAVLKGKLGVRAGFAAGVNFSVLHLNEYLNFGFSAEAGVYEEISGYLRFDYNYENTAGKSASAMALAGGLKSETGIYVQLDFTWNVFGYEDSVTIAEVKFPILTIGSLRFASEFDEPESALTFNTSAFNIKNSGAPKLLDLKFIDISGGASGVTIEVMPAASDGDYAFFAAQDSTGKGSAGDLKYVSVDRATGMISIADNAPDRLDFTVAVQYTRGCSLFSKELTMITKRINFTYMKYKVDDSSKKYKATFLMPDGSTLEEKEYYVGQIPVPPAEDGYEALLVYSPYRIKDWSRPWKEDIAALYADTAYHMDCEPNYKTVTFYGQVLDETTGAYRYGVIAAVQTLAGQAPVPPEPSAMAAEFGWEFSGWSPALRAVQTDYSYTATYRQSDDVCWTSFYLDGGQRISAGFVQKGAVPAPPDMSQYNTADRQFAGWWPALHASSENSETYVAVFREFVTVTFKGRDGKVLSEQKCLAGTTPEAPAVDDVAEGEEPYYEYHFSHWAAEGGTALGPVYEDAVYSPVYETQYLEVTTTFDAAGHAFADGKTVKRFTGAYEPYKYIYLPQVTYRDNQNTYAVEYWKSTEAVNGAYVRLYMSAIHTDYKYDLTFKPVFKSKPVEYTVRFDGGDEALYFKGHYGDLITADMLAGLKKTSTTANYVYKLADCGLTLPYRFGTKLGADGLPAEYLSAVAKFELVGVDKTYAFDANGGKFADGAAVKTVTAPYASHASFTETPAKADDGAYHYAFAGWADSRDAAAGSGYGDFVAVADTTLYAVYAKTPIYCTLTFRAGAGHFADGSAQKTVQVLSGSPAPAFGEIPLRDSTAATSYAFSGWSPAYQSGAAVTASADYTAQYSATPIDYTLTFDAGAGHFAGGEATLTQTYHYGDAITPPANPARDETAYFTYAFTGWSPALAPGATVTGDRAYTANYQATAKDAEYPVSGVTVTLGALTEDINAGSIPGYTYTMVDNPSGGDPFPTLTVTGNGLTFSGTSDKVRVIIASGVTDVTLKNLTLSGAYTAGNAILDMQETASGLTINVSGTCALRNTAEAVQAARFERPVEISGAGAGASLTLAAKGCSESVYCGGALNVDALELEISAQKRAADPGFAVAAVANDGASADWLFSGSTVRFLSEGNACAVMSGIRLQNTSLTVSGEGSANIAGDLRVEGASAVHATASGADATALQVAELRFVDFTGTFNAAGTHAASPGIAVKAFDGIAFFEGGSDVGPGGYDLGGTQLMSFESGAYVSFGTMAGGTPTPATSVTVTK